MQKAALIFNLKPSRSFFIFIIISYCINCFAIYLANIIISIKLIILIIITIYIIYIIKKHVLLSTKKSIIKFWLKDGPKVEVYYKDGRRDLGNIMPDSYISTLFIILRLRNSQYKIINCIITKDSLAIQEYKKIILHCKYCM